MSKALSNDKHYDEIKKTNDYIRNKFNKDKQLVDQKHVESNIEDFLEEADTQKLSTTFMKLNKKKPLACYGLDRDTLIEHYKLENTTVNYIQRIIQLQSSGFQESIENALGNCEHKSELMGRLWIVYNVLLEYCCRTEYTSLMATVASQYKTQNDTFNSQYQQNQDLLNQSYEELYTKQLQMSKEIPLLQIKLKETTRDYNTLKTYNTTLQENHEKEVCMRVIFEDKLNVLNSNQNSMVSAMELMTKEYSATNVKMAEVMGENRNFIFVNQALKSENNSLTADVSYLIQQKNSVTILYDQAKNAIQESNQKEDANCLNLEDKQSEIDDLKSKLEQCNALNFTLKESNESFKGINENSENQLQKSLNQQRKQEEIIESLNLTLINIRKESQGYKTKLDSLTINFNKLNNDQEDQRFNQTYNEEKLQNKDDVINELKISLESLNTKQNKLGNDHIESVVKLRISTRCRNEAENCITILRKQLQKLENEKCDIVDETKKLTKNKESLKDKLLKLDKDYENLIDQYEHQKNINKLQIEDHVKNVEYQKNLYNEQRLQAENQRRLLFEEESEHTNTKKMKIRSDSRCKDLDYKFKKLNLDYESLTSTFCHLELKYNEVKAIQNESEFDQDIKKLKFEDLKYKLDVCKQEEEKKRDQIINNHSTIIDQQEMKFKNIIMQLEDYQAQLNYNHEEIHQYKQINHDLNQNLNTAHQKNDILLNNNNDLNHELEIMNKHKMKLHNEIEDFVRLIQVSNNEIKMNKLRFNNQENKIKSLQSEINQFNDQIVLKDQLISEQLIIQKKLEEYERKSKEVKELNFKQSYASEFKNTQTDLDMDKFDYNQRNQDFCNQNMSKLNLDNYFANNINKSPLKRFITNSSNENLIQANSNNRYSSISRNTIMKDQDYAENLKNNQNFETKFSNNNLLNNDTKLPNKRKILISNTSQITNSLNNVTDTFLDLQSHMKQSRVDLLRNRDSNQGMGMSKSYIDSNSNVNMSTRPNTSGSFMHTMTGFTNKQGQGSQTESRMTHNAQKGNNQHKYSANGASVDKINMNNKEKNDNLNDVSPKVVHVKRKKKSNLSQLLKSCAKWNYKNEEL